MSDVCFEENTVQMQISDYRYYIYAWKNKDWGDIYFYVGKGRGYRYKHCSNRGRAFNAIVSRWDCYPVILETGLTEDQAMLREDYWKEHLIFDCGYPIMDGEGHNAMLKNLACKRKKRELKETVPGWHEGRKPIEVDEDAFSKLREAQKRGSMTVAECCRELGIGRSTWYALCKRAG